MKKCQYCFKEHDKNGTFCSITCANKDKINKLDKKNCLICDIEFQPKSLSAKYCSLKHEKQCINCNETFLIRSRDFNKRELCTKCSRKNSVIKQKETNMKKYGVDNPMKSSIVKEKTKETNLKKYGKEYYVQTDAYKEKVKENNQKNFGVDHTFQRTDVKNKISESRKNLDNNEINAKRAKTNTEKYGIDNVAKLNSIKEKIKQTNLNRYGVEMSLLNPEVAAKRKKTWDKKYGKDVHPLKAQNIKEKRERTLNNNYNVLTPFDSEEIRNKGKETMLEKYGAEYALQVPEFLNKQINTTNERINDGTIKPSKISKINKNFAEDLKNKYNVDVEFEKSLDNSSFDLFIPERNLYIDLNPTVSHNVLIPFGCVVNGCDNNCDKHTIVPNNYHFNRAKIANKADVSLIQIYDWDFGIHKFLNGKLQSGFNKISAKKLNLKKIKQKDANEFLNIYHFQGGTKEQSYCYGLFLDNVLIAVGTFGKSRFNKNYEYEFIRYAVKSGFIVHGASQRLFNAFINEVNPISVISYIDFDHSTKQTTFLNTLGFEEIKNSGPVLSWFNLKKKSKITDLALVLQGADRLLGTNYGSIKNSGLNNKEIMLKEGFLPVYNSGNRVFVWKF